MANDAVPEDAELGSLAITLRTYGLDYMQARHVLEKVRGLLDRASRSADTDALVAALRAIAEHKGMTLISTAHGQFAHAALQQHEEKKL